MDKQRKLEENSAYLCIKANGCQQPRQVRGKLSTNCLLQHMSSYFLITTANLVNVKACGRLDSLTWTLYMIFCLYCLIEISTLILTWNLFCHLPSKTQHNPVYLNMTYRYGRYYPDNHWKPGMMVLM